MESTYLEIKPTLLGRRVLRSPHPVLIAQEIYALLTIYQVIRIAIADGADASGVDPDRVSFTTAVQAAGICSYRPPMSSPKPPST